MKFTSFSPATSRITLLVQHNYYESLIHIWILYYIIYESDAYQVSVYSITHTQRYYSCCSNFIQQNEPMLIFLDTCTGYFMQAMWVTLQKRTSLYKCLGNKMEAYLHHKRIIALLTTLYPLRYMYVPPYILHQWCDEICIMCIVMLGSLSINVVILCYRTSLSVLCWLALTLLVECCRVSMVTNGTPTASRMRRKSKYP